MATDIAGNEIKYGNCYCCGNKAEKLSSGNPECWACWNWRKLDGPAARHWAKVGQEFLSNVDMYDMMKFFRKAGLSQEEWTNMLTHVSTLTQYCNAEIENRKNK